MGQIRVRGKWQDEPDWRRYVDALLDIAGVVVMQVEAESDPAPTEGEGGETTTEPVAS
jgi:hypothetical protein